MSFLEKIKTSRGDCLYLSRVLEDGKPAWAYVLVDKAKLPIFLKKHEEAGTTINVHDYGEIVERGWGEQPPAAVKQRIQEEYS